MIDGIRMHVRFALVLVGTAVVFVTAADAACQVDTANTFSKAAVTPGTSSPVLAAKLARTADYGSGRTGWLAQRLFPLDDNVEITGELVENAACFANAGDGDLTFFVKLSPQSFKKLSAYFLPATATPLYVHVEMVGTLVTFGGAAVFKSWRTAGDLVQFSTEQGPFHDIRATGNAQHAVDWVMLQSAAGLRYVSIRGALVVDMASSPLGAGGLEIHPAEYIRLSSNPL